MPFRRQTRGAPGSRSIPANAGSSISRGIARRRLAAAGVGRVSGGGLCTFSDRGRFFSYRRDGTCGRQATLIWLE